MTVSAPRSGEIWASPAMGTALDELLQLGVGWVALHPYGRLDSTSGVVRFTPADSVPFLAQGVQAAQERGLSVYWTPHLSAWRSFSWRGDIEFGEDPKAWARFFSTYTDFIVDQARFAERHGIELFSVGLEYEGTTHHEREWRAVIAKVREVFHGPLTYAANWDRLDRVPFWDALDLIGVQGYFPVASVEVPDGVQIREGWARIRATLRELSERTGRPVLFSEIGYARSRTVATRPWGDSREHRIENQVLRERLIEGAIEELESTDFVVGMFWWKWIPGDGRRSGNFSMRDPEAKSVLRRRWSAR